MALRYAVATGNWSNTATWDGGTLPTSADDVYSNNFTVTIDQNITVLSLQNIAGSPAVAGGKFLLTNGITVNTTGTGLVAGSATLIEFNLASPNVATVKYTLLNATTSNSNNGAILLSGTGTLNCTGNFQGSGAVISIFKISSNGTLNLVGNCLSYSMNSGNAISITAISATLNWTGNMPSDYRNQNNWGFIAGPGNVVAGVRTTSTINVIGNLTNSDTSGQGAGILTDGICNITGTITPISQLSFYTGVINGGAGSSISVIGIINSNSNRNLAISTLGALTVSGQINCINQGFPISATRFMLANSSSTQITFQTDSSGINKTLYEPGTSLGNPAITDVRNGVTYASGSLTGTLIVPPSGSVALGVPVGNTVGTAMISITDMGALLASYVV
jgi:hypothetical protein